MIAPPTGHQGHQPVLLEPAVDQLVHDPSGFYVDATFGRGSHSREILRRLGPEGRLLAFDRDPQALQAGQTLMASDRRFRFHPGAFSELSSVLAAQGSLSMSGLLADLGVSSPQLDQAERGFSFMRDGPLDMRMDFNSGLPAWQYLETVSQQELEDCLRRFGEERHARMVAGAILEHVSQAQRGEASPLRTTLELAQLVERVLRRRGGRREPGQHPATRTFQAIRIAVNQELDQLTLLLSQLRQWLGYKARLAVISFHSLEDRIVKQFIDEASRPADQRLQRTAGMGRTQFAMLAQATVLEPTWLRKVARIRPDANEIAANPRARSAILRVAECLSPNQQKPEVR
ncbi:MAG: 16S rRNA (cytosine(1402)-N(4))-methyltransferase RsmH [Burkholderiaceae bacterium]